jgi:hypothetical protein
MEMTMKTEIDSKQNDRRAKANNAIKPRKALRVKTRIKAGPIAIIGRDPA